MYEEILREVREDGKISDIYLKNPRVVQITMCPHCARVNTPLVAHFDVKCKYCNHEFKCSPNPNIYSTYALTMLKKLKHKNTLIIYMDIKWTNAEDILEDIAEDFKKLHDTNLMMVKVDGPFQDYKVDKSQCNQCGTCLEELRCLSCNEVFKEENKCPACGSEKITRFYFDKVKYSKKEKRYMCPSCGSERIKFTVFDGNLTKCPSCKSEKITIGYKKPYYILIIRRYGGAIIK